MKKHFPLGGAFFMSCLSAVSLLIYVFFCCCHNVTKAITAATMPRLYGFILNDTKKETQSMRLFKRWYRRESNQ